MNRFDKIRKIVGSEDLAMKITIEVENEEAKIIKEKEESSSEDGTEEESLDDKELRLLYESGFDLQSITPDWLFTASDELKELFKEEFDRCYKRYKDKVLCVEIASSIVKKIHNEVKTYNEAKRIVDKFSKKE